MVLLRGAGTTIGRYGGVNVSSLFRQSAVRLLNSGLGVVRTRDILRRDIGFQFRDAAVSAINQEIRAISARASGLNRIRGDFRPRSTLSKVNMKFSTRFQYTAEVSWIRRFDGERITSNLRFGDDRLLTGDELRGRFRDIADQIDQGGGPTGLEGADIERIQLTSAMEGTNF